MSENVFYRLAPFIQEHIYKNNWEELRPIQVEACRAIFDTDAHLLLATGTASGKTEAAFLPVLTLLDEDPPASIGVLYIAPMKALINDQFYRLNDLLKEAHIPVTHWHGDVSQSQKTKIMRDPGGILQITPESMESMLINRNRDLVRLFGDLRFIVIDEVHAFLGADRGVQVLCQLERLSRYIRREPRRIGLSATLGDKEKVEKWLATGTNRSVITPEVPGTQQKIRLSVEHFFMPDQNSIIRDTVNRGDNTSTAIQGAEFDPHDPYWQYLYEKSLNKRCIIFGNGRDNADSAAAMLRLIAEEKNTPDIYHVHHGSIAAPLKERAELEMKESTAPIVTAATVTLELGIDIGRLERIIQIDSPISVSSLVQRLGRSGRRGDPAEMWFVTREIKPNEKTPFPYRFPWRLLQVIAMIQLYIEERWIEPPKILGYPFSMLYHQIMSAIAEAGELSPAALASRILGMASFRHVSQEDLRQLLKFLIEINHIQHTEERGLIIGLEGAKVTQNYKFYAVFPDEEEYAIMEDTKVVGTIEDPLRVGEELTLAGFCWKVVDVDLKRRVIFVQKIKKKLQFFWHGDRAIIHNKILQRMKKVLFENVDYPYLQPAARERLYEARNLARESALEQNYIYDTGKDSCCIFPWMGHRDYHVLLKMMRHYCNDKLDIKAVGGMQPYFITMRFGNGKAEDACREIKKMMENNPDPMAFIYEHEVRSLKKRLEYKTPKYDLLVPDALLKKGIIHDYVDVDGIKEEVMRWKAYQGM